MYLVQHKALLDRATGKLSSLLPPIHDLEHAAFRLLLIGTLCLTLSLIVGGMLVAASELCFTIKLFITLILWAGYCFFF